MKWSDERVAELRRMFTVEGLSITAIAKALGTTRGAVAGKLHRLGLVGTGRERAHRNRPSKRANYEHERGTWDVRTFEPYAAFKARKQREREHAVR